MKKLLPMMVLCGLIPFSCSKAVEEPQAEEHGYYTFVLNANAGQDLTRTEYADEVTFSWSKDDEISVLFHKGETHKFFTLKTSEGGSATAKFSGQIESGYELGASDTEGGAAWALFPASAQHSWNAETHLPDFYAAPETDFTQSHFSANIPMYANGDADGNFNFKYLTSCYKFVFTDVNASKVKLMVHSSGSGGWYLSGKSPVKADGSSYFLQCYDGEGTRDVSYIAEVDADKKVAFYVPFRGWEPFTPEITLVSMDTDSELLHVTANAPLKALPFGRIIVLPAKSLSDVYIPVIGINGDMSDWEDKPVGEGSNSRILEWKYASDEENVYFMYKVDKTKISFSESYNWGSYIYVGFDNDNDDNTPGTIDVGSGLVGGYEARASMFPWRGTVEGSPECFKGEETQGEVQSPFGTETGHVTIAGMVDDAYSYIEVSIPRSMIGSPSGDITVNHSMNWAATGRTVITLAGPAGPKQATITADDVAVKVGKSVNIGATTNSSAAIKYVSGNTGIATVSNDGTVTGVAVGTTTITLSVPAVEGKFTEATKTINVMVSEASTGIDIDGDMSDWADVEIGYTNESNNYRVFKAAYDKDNIYLYTKRVTVSGQRYIYYDFDLDNDPTTGVSEGSRTGLEAYMALVIYLENAIVENPGADSYHPDKSVYAGVVCKGSYGADFTETELSIPRSNLNIKEGDTIKIYSWGNKSADGVASHPLVLTIEN